MGVHARQHADHTLPLTASSANNPDASHITYQGTATSLTGLVTASSPSAFTTIVKTITAIGSDGKQTPTVASYTVLDSSGYSSITASQAAASSAAAASTASHATSSTSTASTSSSTGTTANSSQKSSSNLNTLIPAIVVPIAVILVASFGLFWFFMRRRHRRDLKNANFVMAGKGEKLQSTSPSTRSSPSSMDTTSPLKPLPKVATTEFPPKLQSRSPPPSYSTGEIGVARALTPQDGHRPPRIDSAAPSASNRIRSPHAAQVRNFNSPRPGTAGHPGHRPPNPSLQYQAQTRNRSNSQPGHRGPSPAQGRPGQPPYRSPPMNTYVRGSPNSPQAQGQSRAHGLPRSPSNGPRPNPRTAAVISPNPNASPSGYGPGLTRAAPPAPLNALPLGAFNGEGPISQYSPIVKETPGKKGLGLRTSGLNDEERSRGMDSPASSAGGIGLGLTDENLRIARMGAGISAQSPTAGNSKNASPVVGRPRQEPPQHRREVSRDEPADDETEDDFDDARSGVSSLHEMERFDFDNWDGDGTNTRRVSRDDDRGGRVSPIQRERDSFSLDVR